MARTVIFPRSGVNIIANIIKTVLEPSEVGPGHQVVFFCQDKDRRRYRVPKRDVTLMGTTRNRREGER